MCAVLAFGAGRAHAVGEAVDGFPNWAERVIHQWMNRARVDPQLEMTACGANCAEGACYSVMPPLIWNQALNRAARFHSDELVRQQYFAHDSACTLVPNIGTLYPTSCNGSASCACVGGTKTCSPTCTSTWERIQRFGVSGSGEIIASPSDPNSAFYLWLREPVPANATSCVMTSSNGHRWLILKSSGAVGVGVAGYSTGDFGAGSNPPKIPSGSHYPQQSASVGMWANWYATAGPSRASVNIDGVCTTMTLQRGTQTNGAWSATVTGMGSGCHRYYFSFQDSAGNDVTYPTTGSLAIGSGASCPDWDSARPASCAIGTPTSTPTATPIPVSTATATASSTPSRTATATATATRTLVPSATATRTASATASRTPSATMSATPTRTVAPSGVNIGGSVLYYSSSVPVPGVVVRATSATLERTAPTNAAGVYLLTDVPTANLLVAPAGGVATGDAVSALDAAYVLQSVAGLRTLSARQALACDVTGDGTLSALDAALLLQYSVGVITTFPVNSACQSDWAFVPTAAAAANQTLIQPEPGSDSCTQGGIAYQSLPTSASARNFAAIVFGDCTGNWQPAN